MTTEAASEPWWLQNAEKTLDGLLLLAPGWDSYGATKIDHDVVESARQLLRAIADRDTPMPSVVPTSSGGVQLEWHASGIDLEIALQTDKPPHVFFEDIRTHQQLEFEMSAAEADRVKEAVRRLSRGDRADEC